MGFMIPCCFCGGMLTTFVQRSAFKIVRQLKYNHKGEVTVDQELDSERQVCNSCVTRMEDQGHIFDRANKIVVKYYAEDGQSAMSPTPDIPYPPSQKAAKAKESGTTVVTTEAFQTPTRLGYKDVQIEYLLNGIVGVENLFTEKKVSSSAIRRALSSFQEAGRDVGALERWVINNTGRIGRGRDRPAPGEARTYRAQQVKKSGPFIRLPLDAIGAYKGKMVKAEFEKDRIVIELL